MLIDYGGVFLAPQVSVDHSGLWAGLHSQKNVAGYFSAISTLIWLIAGFQRRRKLLIIIACFWLFFLIRTDLKTSILLFISVIIFSVYIYYGLNKRFSRSSVLFIILSLIILVVFSVLVRDLSTQSDPSAITFTGRTQIWAFVWSNVVKTPFIGVGYGSFWAIGPSAPALLNASAFVAQYTEAHNGYLDVLVTLGAVGLALSIMAFLLPYRLLFSYRSPHITGQLRAGILCAFAIMTFGLSHNFLESSIMQGLSWLWTITLISNWQAILYLREARGLR